jgi:beta-fructofuranosidase
VRVYEDRSSLEIFLNDGEVVMSTRFYPKTEERVIVLEPQEGTVRMTEGVFYELGDIFA